MNLPAIGRPLFISESESLDVDKSPARGQTSDSWLDALQRRFERMRMLIRTLHRCGWKFREDRLLFTILYKIIRMENLIYHNNSTSFAVSKTNRK